MLLWALPPACATMDVSTHSLPSLIFLLLFGFKFRSLWHTGFLSFASSISVKRRAQGLLGRTPLLEEGEKV